MPSLSQLHFCTVLLIEVLFASAAGIAYAQSNVSVNSLPSAPVPNTPSEMALPSLNILFAQSVPKPAANPAADQDTPADPPETPVLTMFPHPEDARYWISGQANIIFQGRLPFHSLYEGTNSFRS